MDIDIRKSIINNFKDSNVDEIKKSIEESIYDKDEITLPGLGVFFEILWNNSDDTKKDYILQRINTYDFKNPVEVMNNISSVTEYIRAKIKQGGISAKRFVLHYYKNVDDSIGNLLFYGIKTAPANQEQERFY